MRDTKKLREGTVIEGNGVTYQRDSVAPHYSLVSDVVNINEIKLPKDLKAYLTFAINTSPEPEHIIDYEKKDKMKDAIVSQHQAYLNQIKNPWEEIRKGKEKIIYPITPSLNLIDLIKNKGYFKNGPAYIKIIRFSDLNLKYIGIGVYDLYKEYMANQTPPTLDELIANEINSISRKSEFEIGIPKAKPQSIAVLKGDTKYPFSPFISISPNKINAEIMESGGMQIINQNELKDNIIIFGFGKSIGPIHKLNPRKRGLMYITPKEILPRL